MGTLPAPVDVPAPAIGVRNRRSQRDLTQDRLGRLVAQLSAPATAEMALFSLVGLIHAYWMGQVGGSALAATAIGTTLRLVVISPMMGLSMGGLALVSHHVGAGERERADHAVMQTIVLAIVIVTPLSIIGLTMSSLFLHWMGTSGALYSASLSYVRVIFAGLVFMELLPTMNGVIRGAGHPEQTLRIIIIHVIVLFATEAALVNGWGPLPQLGVEAAAWASVIGSAAGVVVQGIVLMRGSAGVRLNFRDISPCWSTMRRILRIAVPTSAQRLSPNLANALLMRLVAGFGTTTITAYSLMTRVSGFLTCPGMGISNATSALVGQNLGARKPGRATRAILVSSVAAAVASLGLFLGLNLWPRGAIGMFRPTAEVSDASVVIARYMLLSGTMLSLSTVLDRALTAAGDALATMAISMASLWLGQLGMAWLLSRVVGMGPSGIWLGIGLGYVVSVLGMIARFATGKWRRIEV